MKLGPVLLLVASLAISSFASTFNQFTADFDKAESQILEDLKTAVDAFPNPGGTLDGALVRQFP